MQLVLTCKVYFLGILKLLLHMHTLIVTIVSFVLFFSLSLSVGIETGFQVVLCFLYPSFSLHTSLIFSVSLSVTSEINPNTLALRIVIRVPPCQAGRKKKGKATSC